MPTYECPECHGTLEIGLEVSVGGAPEHKCTKCEVEMKKTAE